MNHIHTSINQSMPDIHSDDLSTLEFAGATVPCFLPNELPHGAEDAHWCFVYSPCERSPACVASQTGSFRGAACCSDSSRSADQFGLFLFQFTLNLRIKPTICYLNTINTNES